MNLQVYEKLVDIHRDINYSPLDNIYFYVQEWLVLPYFFYNLQSCELAQGQWKYHVHL